MNTYNFNAYFKSKNKEVIKKLGTYYDYGIEKLRIIALKNPLDLYHRDFFIILQTLFPNSFISCDKVNDYIVYKIVRLKNGKVKLVKEAVFPRINIRNRVSVNIYHSYFTLLDLSIALFEKNNIEISCDWYNSLANLNLYGDKNGKSI